MSEKASEAAVSCDRAELRALIAKQLRCPVDRVLREARLIDDLGADSLALVQLALALEEAFELEIANSEVPTLLTVEDVHRFVQRGRARGKGRAT